MENVIDLVVQGALALLGAALSLGAFFVGRVALRKMKEEFSSGVAREAAECAVLAAEQILGAGKGGEKLSLALDFALGLLSEKGISCSRDQMEVLIEATVASFNGAFREAGE